MGRDRVLPTLVLVDVRLASQALRACNGVGVNINSICLTLDFAGDRRSWVQAVDAMEQGLAIAAGKNSAECPVFLGEWIFIQA